MRSISWFAYSFTSASESADMWYMLSILTNCLRNWTSPLHIRFSPAMYMSQAFMRAALLSIFQQLNHSDVLVDSKEDVKEDARVDLCKKCLARHSRNPNFDARL